MTEKIANYLYTKQIIDKYNFFFKKKYGQNFLIDINILNKIISAADINLNDTVLEIGPGIGSLTQILAEHSKKVIAVELDEKLIPILQETLNDYTNIELINNDILKLDIKELIYKNNIDSLKIVANLPYYITTPIIMKLLEQRLPIQSITIMVQKEVAQRIQATPSTKEYGALSLAVSYYCNPQIAFIVPANCFMPKPNVDSAVLYLDIHKEPPIDVADEKLMFNIIKMGFQHRRKTLANCLNNLISKDEIMTLLTKANLDKNIRAEALSLEQFGMLSNILMDMEIRK